MFWLYVGAVFAVMVAGFWLYDRRRGIRGVNLRHPGAESARARGLEQSIRHNPSTRDVGGGAV